MKELGITKGDLSTSEQQGKPNHCFQAQVFINNKNLCSFEPTKNPEEATKNAELTSDAFEVAQKTNLLPSELLERYNEAIEVLEESLKVLKEFAEEQEYSVGEVDDDVVDLIKKQEQTISKAKGE